MSEGAALVGSPSGESSRDVGGRPLADGHAWEIRRGDAARQLRRIPSESVQCCVTSPPYWGLRDYEVAGQIGIEPTLGEYLDSLVKVFEQVRRVLRPDGILWLNLGDTYNARPRGAKGSRPARALDPSAGSQAHKDRVRRPPSRSCKPKDLMGVPWLLAFRLREAGWWLRSEVIWNKPNAKTESVKDRPTRSHEHLFLLTKSARYFYDDNAIREPASPEGIAREKRARSAYSVPGQAPDRRGDSGSGTWVTEGRNKRSVWTISTKPSPWGHGASFPPELVEPCIRSGSAVGDLVLDPFAGTSTVGAVALSLQRSYLGVELNPRDVEQGRRRLAELTPDPAQVPA